MSTPHCFIQCEADFRNQCAFFENDGTLGLLATQPGITEKSRPENIVLQTGNKSLVNCLFMGCKTSNSPQWCTFIHNAAQFAEIVDSGFVKIAIIPFLTNQAPDIQGNFSIDQNLDNLTKV